jgi:hypothetical protein
MPSGHPFLSLETLRDLMMEADQMDYSVVFREEITYSISLLLYSIFGYCVLIFCGEANTNDERYCFSPNFSFMHCLAMECYDAAIIIIF